MRRCEDEKMWRWEDVKMRGCEDEKMFYRPPLLEEHCAQTLSGKTTCKSSRNYLGLLVRILEPLVKVLETTYTHKHWFLMVLGYLTNLNPSIQMILDGWIFQTLVCQSGDIWHGVQCKDYYEAIHNKTFTPPIIQTPPECTHVEWGSPQLTSLVQ
jgi:hypothetical protein